MKKLSVLGAGLLMAVAVSPANADGYVGGGLKGPPCCDSWSGFYVGIHGGYGWKDNDFHEFLGTINNTQFYVGGVDSRGWLFGVQAGHNWQRGQFVGGLEIDLSGTGINGDSSPVVLNFGGGVTQTVIRSDDVKWLGSARARLGIAPGGCCSNFLLYGTGGLAWERYEQTNTTVTLAPGITQTVVTTIPNDRFGWVVGLGAEAKLGGTGWIGRIEYLHYQFGTSQTSTVVQSNIAGGNFAEKGNDQTIDVIRAGLSYKF